MTERIRLCFVLLFAHSGLILPAQSGFYIPKALLTPVHTQSQELHVSLGLGGGYDANLSYAFAPHMALFCTGNLRKGTSQGRSLWGDRTTTHKNNYVWSAGIGYFTDTKASMVNTFESYLGFGRSKVDNFWYFTGERELGSDMTQARYWTVFWQLNAVYKQPRQEATAALRVSYSKYPDFVYWDNDNNQSHHRYKGFWGMTADPVISYSYLFKQFKCNVQAGASLPLTQVRLTEEGTTVLPNSGFTKIGLAALIGRLSIQRNFNFGKREKQNN